MNDHSTATNGASDGRALDPAGPAASAAAERSRRKGGRPKKAGPRRTERVDIVVTPHEKAEMIRTAEAANLSVAELVRRRVLGRPVQSKTDAEARRSLRRIGGNLNQIARRMNAAGSAGGTSAVLEATLAADVSAGVAELRAAVAELMRGGEQ